MRANFSFINTVCLVFSKLEKQIDWFIIKLQIIELQNSKLDFYIIAMGTVWLQNRDDSHSSQQFPINLMFVAKTRFSDSICHFYLIFSPLIKRNFHTVEWMSIAPSLLQGEVTKRRAKNRGQSQIYQRLPETTPIFWPRLQKKKLFMTTLCQEIMKFLCDQTLFFLSRTTITIFFLPLSFIMI